MRADTDQRFAPDREHPIDAQGGDTAAPVFARVEVTTEPSVALPVWRELERIAPISPFQTAGFLLPWIATEGAAANIMPLLAMAFDHQNRPLALLPLGRQNGRVMSVATFLGGKHANFNMGLFRPGLCWRPADVAALLRAVARAAPVRLDLFAFTNQPSDWTGVPNPLVLKRSQLSPSFSHRTALTADADAFFRTHHSAHARKLLRSKRSRLEALGPVSHVVARSADEVQAIVAAYVAQKSSKLASIGIAADLGAPSLQAFLEGAALPSPERPAALELHALRCGERIVATFGGVAHAGRVSGMLISHDGMPEYARNSPGELLLASVIRMKCLEGCTSFDLGIGEARYKEAYCPIAEPLVDSFFPITPGGWLWLEQASLRLRLKGAVKRSAWAWASVQRLRKLRGRIAPPPASGG